VQNLGLSILFNSLWIVGLALLLATASYHYDRARQEQSTFRKQARSRSFILAAWISATLVALGLAGTSTRLWEAAIWIVLALMSLANVVTAWRNLPGSPAQEPLHKD
jgi:4-hydroxybenzoate polyprenyltransferase